MQCLEVFIVIIMRPVSNKHEVSTENSGHCTGCRTNNLSAADKKWQGKTSGQSSVNQGPKNLKGGGGLATSMCCLKSGKNDEEGGRRDDNSLRRQTERVGNREESLSLEQP